MSRKTVVFLLLVVVAVGTTGAASAADKGKQKVGICHYRGHEGPDGYHDFVLKYQEPPLPPEADGVTGAHCLRHEGEIRVVNRKSCRVSHQARNYFGWTCYSAPAWAF